VLSVVCRGMPITPDGKDWTWVLKRPCPECGFDSAAILSGDVAELIRANASAWREVLARPTGLTVRPSDNRWSSLEYACHVRDVFRLYDARLELMLTEDNPTYPNWDQDATAVEANYAEQQPALVARDLRDAAGQIADRFDGVSGAAWQRTGTRSDGARFTVETFARYLLHDVVHHLHDVRTTP
jgi:DinB superfamily